jgi:tetratricopeptide (TPR) repeat protein
MIGIARSTGRLRTARLHGIIFAVLVLACIARGETDAQKPPAAQKHESGSGSLQSIITNDVVPGPVEDLIESGNHLMNLHRYDEAIAAYNAAREKAGKPVYTIWLNLGSAYLQKGDYAQASDCFSQALSMRANDPSAHLGAAEAAYDRKRYPEAEEHYRKVIQFSRGPLNLQAHHFLGVTLYAEHRLDESITEFKTAIDQAHGVYGEAHYDLGVAYMDQNKDVDAEREFRTAIEQDRGTNADDYYNLGVILEREKRPKEAADAYATYLKLAPNATDAEMLKKRIAILRRQ